MVDCKRFVVKKEEKKRKKRKKGGKNWDLKYFFLKSTRRFFSYAQCFFILRAISGIVHAHHS